MSKPVVEVRELSRRFEHKSALQDVTFTIQPGLVYGLVGANGQGKTTLIRHLLGLLRAQTGSVRVFGLDPVKHPVQVLQRIGYLSEERELPEWMRVHELLKYTAAYHPNWDQDCADELLGTFALDSSVKVRDLSKGMRAQAGLIAAIAHRPDLLLLDEPSTGLDAIIRKDILNEVIRAVADDGRTAVFSSHLLDEVELMSDYVLMLDGGQLILQGDLDDVKEQHQVLSISHDGESLPGAERILSARRHGSMWTAVCAGPEREVVESFASRGIAIAHCRQASLQEIFVARVGRDRVQAEVAA